MLFKRKAKRPPVIWTKSFPQAGSFRGFKRIKLTTYKEDGVAENLTYFEKNGISKGQTIELQCVDGGDWKAVNVYIDARRVGCLYDTHTQWNMISAPNCDKAYVSIQDGEAYLFLHLI